MANPPVVGDKWTAVIKITDRKNVPIDPISLTYKYRKPISKTLVSVTYATGMSNFRKISTGNYEFDIPCEEVGTYWNRFETDLGVQEGSFTVVRSQVI